MITIFKSTQPQIPGFFQNKYIDARYLGTTKEFGYPEEYHYWEINTKLSISEIQAGVALNPIVVDYGIDYEYSLGHDRNIYNALREEVLSNPMVK